MLQRLSGLNPDTSRLWGTMTPGEMLCHLGDTADSVLSGRQATNPRWRPLYKWLALSSTLAWPHGARTPAAVDPRLGGTKPSEFARDLARAIDGLRRLASSPEEAFSTSHSKFGAMSRVDWQRWAWRHTDHHLKQFGL